MKSPLRQMTLVLQNRENKYLVAKPIKSAYSLLLNLSEASQQAPAGTLSLQQRP